MEISAKELDSEAIVGKQWLAIIAINRYEEWTNLQYPVIDAEAIRDVLTDRYYIDEVLELYNSKATKSNIIKLFVELQENVEPNDSVLIYYSGHGHLDEKSNSGFWIPFDAGLDQFAQNNWLPNSQIRGLITNLKTKHLLIISDSCFSGDLLDVARAKPPTIDNDYFKTAYSRVSRQVLTSGASEAVPDRSEFALLLKMALGNSTDPYLDPLMLFNEVRLGVTKTTPLIGNLQSTGHQNGASFLLFRKLEAVIMDLPPAEEEQKESIVMDLPPSNEEQKESVATKLPPAQEKQERPIITNVPPPKEKQHESISTVRLDRNYFSTGVGAALTIPVGVIGEIMIPAFYPIVFFNYNLNSYWGVISFGILAGTNIDSTREEISYQYDLLSIPIGINARYSTNFDFPLFAFLELSSGLAINIVSFKEEYDNMNDITAAKFFLMPTIGGGYFFMPELSLSIYSSILVISFENSPYLGVSPGVKVEYSF